jgi:hemerythrin
MEPPLWKLEWNEEMSVGIPEIDHDHKRFIFLVDELNRAIVDRMSLEEIRVRMQIIVDDALTHFAREEKLFGEWHYPEAEEHSMKHKNTVLTLQALQEKFVDYGLPAEWITVGLEVKDVLIKHLLIEDMKYAEYFRKTGKTAPQPGT